jgi:hypothetical protein
LLRRFSRFLLVDPTIWLPYLLSDNLGTSLYQCSLSNFTSTSYICYRVVQHTQYQVSLYIVLFSILGILIKCGLLSRQIIDTICIRHLFLMVILLLDNNVFVIFFTIHGSVHRSMNQ